MIDLRSQKDLVVLVADTDIQFAVRGVLSHPEKLPIRPPCADIIPHPQRDPGCRKSGHDLLRPYAKLYRYAIVIFDRHGCGQDLDSRQVIEADLEHRLSNSGWLGRAAAVCIDPELEIWAWSDSPQVEAVLGWQGRDPSLRTWMLREGFVAAAGTKPRQPKECWEAALKIARKQKSSQLFADLAARVAYARCTDQSFGKLVTTLRSWFPVTV